MGVMAFTAWLKLAGWRPELHQIQSENYICRDWPGRYRHTGESRSRVSAFDRLGRNLTILDSGLRRYDAWGGNNTLRL